LAKQRGNKSKAGYICACTYSYASGVSFNGTMGTTT
jgi:hypothetical protein